MFKIVIFSFSLTGVLFYLSKSGQESLAAKEPEVKEQTAPAAKPAFNQPKSISKTVQAPKTYAELLPESHSLTASSQKSLTRPEEAFENEQVRPSINRCFQKLYKKRMDHKVRDKGGSASLAGQLKIVTNFEDSQVLDLHTVSNEIRDDEFHNCVQTAAKSWKYPASIAAQSQWIFATDLKFTLNVTYDCDVKTRISGSDAGITAGAGNCF